MNRLVYLILLVSCSAAQAGYPCYYYKPQTYGYAATQYQMPAQSNVAWRTEFLRVVKDIQHKNADTEDWNAALSVLGGTYTPQGSPLVAQQGSTVYAETYKGAPIGNLLQPYTQQNLEVIWHMANQHQLNQQTATLKGQEGFIQALKEAGANDARITKALVALEILKDTPEFKKEYKSSINTNQPNAPGAWNPERPPDPFAGGQPQVGRSTLQSVISSRCKGCHNATNANADLDMTKFAAFSQSLKERVWAAIENPDESKRMPLAQDAGGNYVPGVPLSFSEKVVFGQ